MNERNNEVIIGGVLGFFAVGAILVKLVSVRFTLDSATQAVIDFSGIGVSLLLFYTVLKDKIPSPFFEKNMKSKMDIWQNSSFGLITNSEKHINDKLDEDKDNLTIDKSFIRYMMLCNFSEFLKSGSVYSGKTGEFLKLPLFATKNYKNGTTLRFYLNKTTLLSRLKGKNDSEINDYIGSVAKNIEMKLIIRFGNYIDLHDSKRIGSNQKYEITIVLKGNFTQNSNIDILIDMINYVMLLYSYAA